MDHSLLEIKQLRVQLGLTQKDLAMLAKVSQSLIAKVEAGVVDPSYSAGKRMLDALSALQHKAEPQAFSFMQKHPVVCHANDKVSVVISKMQKKAISQLPVLEGDNLIGVLSEGGIVKRLESMKQGMLVREVMDEAPPTVPKDTPLRVVANLLGVASLVVVKEKGKIKGLITKADLLRAV